MVLPLWFCENSKLLPVFITDRKMPFLSLCIFRFMLDLQIWCPACRMSESLPLINASLSICTLEADFTWSLWGELGKGTEISRHLWRWMGLVSRRGWQTAHCSVYFWGFLSSCQSKLDPWPHLCALSLIHLLHSIETFLFHILNNSHTKSVLSVDSVNKSACY